MGRKKLPKDEKKKVLRIFVSEKTIRANGGYGASVKKCVKVLDGIYLR